MPIEGKSVYEPEVMEMMKRLNAKSIIMLVIEGNKGGPIEYASAVQGTHDLAKMITALEVVTASLKVDFLRIVTDPSFRRNPVN